MYKKQKNFEVKMRLRGLKKHANKRIIYWPPFWNKVHSIQRTLLQNWRVITSEKLQKIKIKTFYASEKENEEMKKSKTKNIHAAVFAARDHLDAMIA